MIQTKKNRLFSFFMELDHRTFSLHSPIPLFLHNHGNSRKLGKQGGIGISSKIATMFADLWGDFWWHVSMGMTMTVGLT